MITVFELAAKLLFDSKEFDDGLEQSSKKASKFSSAVSTGLKVVGGAIAAGVGAAAAGTVAMTKSAVSAYGEFQQLEGGVKKLFGTSGQTIEEYAKSVGKTVSQVENEYRNLEQAQNDVFSNAANAYRTAGMSANTYMETVTSFSGTLIQDLKGNTVEAARLADIALRDMGDNFNTFGGDLESVMNAYKGFSKDNYTMLDNLRLGYGGTASEMVRLIKDSGVLGKAADDLTTKNLAQKVSFGQIIEAIHITQERMNIAGTTFNEAGSTITGSIGAVKGAWENLLAGLANPDADLGQLIDNVITTAGTAIEQIAPTITKALSGIATLIDKVAPVIVEQLPVLIDRILPPLLSAATSIFTSVMRALPSLLKIITEQLPVVLGQIFPAIMEILPGLITTISELLVTLVNFIADNADSIVPAIVSIIQVIVSTLTSPTVMVPLLRGGLQIIDALAQGIAENAPAIAALIPEILANLIVALEMVWPQLKDTVVSLLQSLALTILGLVGGLMGMSYDEVLEAFLAIDEEVTNFGANIILWLSGLWDSISSWWTESWTSVSEWVTELVDKVGEAGSDILADFVNFFAEGIEGWTGFFDDVINGVLNWGENLVNTFQDQFKKALGFVTGFVNDLLDAFDFDWKLPEIKLPHISIKGGEAPYGIGGVGSLPQFSIKWYKDAYNNPMLLDNATIFGMAGNHLLGGGEGNGSEMIYGKDALMRDIGAVVDSRLNNLQFVVPVYIGSKKIDQQIVTATARANVISGGR